MIYRSSAAGLERTVVVFVDKLGSSRTGRGSWSKFLLFTQTSFQIPTANSCLTSFLCRSSWSILAKPLLFGQPGKSHLYNFSCFDMWALYNCQRLQSSLHKEMERKGPTLNQCKCLKALAQDQADDLIYLPEVRVTLEDLHSSIC